MGDLDIWINRTEVNASSILECINEFGFASYNLTINDLTEEGNVIQLGYPPVRIDIINQLDGVHFSECIKNRKEESFQGVEYYFIGYEDLLANKKQLHVRGILMI